MNYKIIDNFLDDKDFLELQSTFYSYYFPWYAGPTIDEKNTKYVKYKKTNYNFHFSHAFYLNGEPNSSYMPALKPLINKIDPLAIVRVKANLEVKTNKIFENGMHTDFEDEYENCTTAVFYLNTNNGYTKFEDGSVVNSVANRLVTFDSRILHTGSTCTDEYSRIVLNLNYIKKKKENDY